jgi:hypothetical protein
VPRVLKNVRASAPETSNLLSPNNLFCLHNLNAFSASFEEVEIPKPGFTHPMSVPDTSHECP